MNAKQSMTLNPADIPEIARKAGALNDRAWVAILMLFGIIVLSFMMMRFDSMQREQMDFFKDTLRLNTEALVKCSIVLERLDRK